MKKIALMGSTGSIGTQTLDIVRAYKNDYKIVGLSAGHNLWLLEKQAREFLPELIVIENEDDADILRSHLSDTNIKVSSGMNGLIELASMESSDIFVTAIVGMIGIKPSIAAVEAGKDIALANKETLVTAGHIIMPLAKKNNVSILPVDSEHSAVFQCLQGNMRPDGSYPVSRLWITASGGAFRGLKTNELKSMKAEDALKHPNWSMGKKVTIDSATLVNKGLEVIEAHWLFGMPADRIEVVVQPDSIIHSMVEFEDGAVMAQLGVPDMHLPIQYALTYPNRCPLQSERLDFHKLSRIEFESPDTETFKGLPLAVSAIKTGGSMPTVFNAANEKAVAMFLDGRIGFLDIFDIIERSMASHRVLADPSLDEILQIEKETYGYIESRW
jgi:1-deoxy-D-xylulose-5-phosphate reductoisomerase